MDLFLQWFNDSFQWFENNLPIVSGVLILFIVVAAFKVGSYSSRFKRIENEFSQVTEKVEFLKEKSKCVMHSTVIDQMDAMLRNIQFSISKNSKFFANQGKRELTELGERLFEESGCKLVLHKMGNLLISKIDERKPQTALDIEIESHNIIFLYSKGMTFSPVKDYIFNNPDFSGIDIDLNIICHIMGIKLRNLYLLKQKHIEVREPLPDVQ